MKFKIIITIILFAALSLTAIGQSGPIKPLKIGDKIPDFLLKNLLNNAVKTQKASDFYKNGLLIINFWATWCVPCVRTMPYLDSTVARFPKNLKIVCVTIQPKQEIVTFLMKNHNLNHLIFSCNETQLIKYFPHSGIPHNVWIDRNGYVRAITDDDQIIDSHIKEFLLGKTDLYVKKDSLFDWRKPLSVADTEFLYRSVFTKIKDEIGTGGILLPDTVEDQTRFMAWNLPKTNMIWAAFKRSGFTLRDFKLMDIHAKDTLSYYTPLDGSTKEWKDSSRIKAYQLWRHQNEYCYELYFRNKVNLDTFYSLMSQEVEQLFNISAKMEDKETICWVITKLPNANLPVVSNQKFAQALDLTQMLEAKKQTLKEIAESLSYMYGQQPPFVDETGIIYPIDIKYDYRAVGESLTVNSLKAYLNSIGLDITLKQILYPHLIVYDHN